VTKTHDAAPDPATTSDEPTPISGLDEIDIREIAAKLRRDVRSVWKVARGGRLRGVADADVRRAIQERLAAKAPRAEPPTGLASLFSLRGARTG